jgi:hypothetical protein
MGKLSGSHQDQGHFDSGLLPAQWYRLFPVSKMVQETCQWSEYRSGVGSGCTNGISTNDSCGNKSFSASIWTSNDKGELREYRVFQRIEGMPEIHELRALEAACREVGGLMLAITGATRLYYVAGFTDMRYGKYALANVVRYQLHRNPYNGDGYMFMSKDRQKMKILVYSHNLYRLYDLSYDKGLSFMKIENEDGTPVTGSKPIDWKYLVALLNCPVRKKLIINSN